MMSTQCLTFWLAVVIFCTSYVQKSYGANQCLGSNCYCTDYPVYISCMNGHPNYIDTMLKRVAVELEIDGDGPEDVAKFQLSEFVSLESVDVKIADDKVCEWLYENEKNFPTIKINGPPYCRKNDDDDDDDEITMSPIQIAAWVMATVIILILVFIRKKIE